MNSSRLSIELLKEHFSIFAAFSNSKLLYQHCHQQEAPQQKVFIGGVLCFLRGLRDGLRAEGVQGNLTEVAQFQILTLR